MGPSKRQKERVLQAFTEVGHNVTQQRDKVNEEVRYAGMERNGDAKHGELLTQVGHNVTQFSGRDEPVAVFIEHLVHH